MVDEVIATGRSYSVKLMVWQLTTEMAARGATGAEELIIRIIHLVAAHHRFEASLVERTVVRHQRQAFDQRLNLFPNVWEHRSILGIRLGNSMYHSVPVKIVVWFWLNQGIELIRDNTVTYHHYPNTAHTGGMIVGGLKIDGSEVVHFAKITQLINHFNIFEP